MKIATVKITRFVVRDATGKTVKTFSTKAAAKSWLAGYLKAHETMRKMANR